MFNPNRSSSVDHAIANTLDEAYGNLTRRSFLSMVTRKLIGLTGVVVASEVLPFLAAPLKAAGQYEVEQDCGLHGYHCASGNCDGGTPGRKWVQCCPANHTDSCPTKWSCCTYLDYCGPVELEYSGCQGVEPGGTSWCGPAPNTFYRCTWAECPTDVGSLYNSEQQCKTACMNMHQSNYCADDPQWP